MTEDALGRGRMFAMIQPDASRAALPSGPALFRVGCLGRLSSFSETEDGRYLITLFGLIRFTWAEELPMRRGYRQVRGDFSDYLADLGPPPDPPNIGVPREDVLGALRSYFAHTGFDANWDAIGKMADDTLVTTLSMVCPFQPAEKQALLEAPTDADRGTILLTLLKMGAAGGDPTGSGRAVS